MSAARKFNHEDVYKQLDSLDMKKTQLLSDLVLSSDSSTIEAIAYWMRKKQVANEEGLAICNNQIDILERIMMAKAIIVEDLLGAIEVTGGIPTVMEKSIEVAPIVNETVTVEELEQKETPVLDIATGKPVVKKEEVAKEVIEPVKTEVKKAVKETEVIVGERKPLDVIKAEVTALIQSGKKDEGKELYASYMKKGMWLNGKGKAGNAWNEKEFANAWEGLLKKTEIVAVKAHVEATETKVVEVVVDAQTEIKEEVVAESSELEFEKAKLALDETNLKTYQKFYPEDTEATKNIVNFTKSIRNITEEEHAIQKVYDQVVALFTDNKVNDAAELTRLFFSERAYDEVQVGKWLGAASFNSEIKNHLAFLNESVTLKESDSIESMITMATEAVRKNNVSKDTLKAWFRDNALGKKLKDLDSVIEDEETLSAKFIAVFNWLFESKPTRTPVALIQVTTVLTEELKKADAKVDNFVDVITKARETLKGKGHDFKLNELMVKAKELAKTANVDLLKAYNNRKNFKGVPVGPAPAPVAEIKPNEAFDKGEVVKENPTSDSPGVEETTPSTTSDVVELVDAIIEFKVMEDLMYHLTMMFKETNDKAKVTAEAIKYMVTLNSVEEASAKGWTPEQVTLMVDGLLNPSEEVIEKTVETGEPVATVETAASVAETTTEDVSTTQEPGASEKPAEPVKSSSILDVDLKAVTKANNKSQFEEAVKIAYTNNNKALSDTDFIAAIIGAIKAPGSGKYITNIYKNKVDQTTAQINKVINPKP